MKTTTILKSGVMACIIVLGMTNCNNSPKKNAEKLENAQENLDDATQNLQQAVLDSTNEYTRYKSEAQAKLTANELKIAELKATLKTDKAEMRVKYEKQLLAIEKKNQDLKTSIANYQENDKNKWEKFKEAFNRDLDSLGTSISKITLK